MPPDRLPFADALADVVRDYNDLDWDDLAAALEAEAAQLRVDAAAGRQAEPAQELPHWPASLPP